MTKIRTNNNLIDLSLNECVFMLLNDSLIYIYKITDKKSIFNVSFSAIVHANLSDAFMLISTYHAKCT